MTREEHLAWARQRALEYLPHDPALALASMTSVLRKHPETAETLSVVAPLMGDLMMNGYLSTAHDVQKWIEGFG